MSDMHSFSVDVAKEVGVNAAILLQSIKWWCQKNKANGKNYHDGLWWTYNSVKAWQELYPYLGKSAIDSALKRLEKRGFIKVGNHNKSAYDRTKWYAITEDGLRLFGDSISGNREMEEAENGNGIAENEKPIPVTSQIPSTDTSTDTDIPFSAIIDYLNERAGTSYRPTTPKTKACIHARWGEGYRLDDFKAVIDVKADEWLSDATMRKYVRPETLFGTKFEGYLQQARQKGANDGIREYLRDYDF